MKISILTCFGDLMLQGMGPSTRVFNLAKNLAKPGNEIHIVIPGRKETIEWMDGVLVHKINGLCPKKVLEFSSRLLGVSRYLSLSFYDLSFLLRACPIILKSDIIQVEDPTAAALMILLLKKVFRKPVVVEDRDTFQAIRINEKKLRVIIETFTEKITLKLASKIVLVSEQDRRFLIQYMPNQQDKVLIVPNGVDTEAFKPAFNKNHVQDGCDLKGLYKIVFVGNMEYFPNQEAVRIIASDLAPSIQREIGNVKFLIVGRTPRKMLHNSPNSPDLVFTGVVKDVAKFLNASDVAIAPILHGSGVRFKILEYFACGLPVVATKIAAEGLEVKDGENILIEDDMHKFAAKVVSLLRDKGFSTKLGRAARDLAINKYSWGKIVKQLDSVYYKLISKDICNQT